MTADRLLALVGAGDVGAVQAALHAEPTLVNAVGPHPFWGGRPQALHLAIEGNRQDMFELLLAHGADINGANDDYDHWSPLMLAIQRGHTEMRDELLRRGARIGLLESLMLGHDDEVDAWIGRGPLPVVSPNGGSLLAFARTTHAIDRLLELGASATQTDRWGAAPIDALSRLGATGRPLVAHLMARGVEAAPQEYARLGDLPKLQALAERRPGVVLDDLVMMGAVDFGHRDIVTWLLSQGASANARSGAQSHHTALHSSAWNGDVEMVHLLLEAGADRSLRDEQYNATPDGWAETSIHVTNNPRCVEVLSLLRASR